MRDTISSTQSDQQWVAAGIAIALLLFGIYRLLLVLPLVIAGSSTLLLPMALLLEAISSIVCAAGIFVRRPWVVLAFVIVGVCVMVTSLIEAFIFGITPFLRALIVCAAVAASWFVVIPFLRRLTRSG